MSYNRVIPRDLFNEANLLKCLGQLYLNLEMAGDVDAKLQFWANAGDPFEIDQNPNSGGIFPLNIKLVVRGWVCDLERPLNSRKPWPLYLTGQDDDEAIPVFDIDGTFSDEMEKFLAGAPGKPGGES